MCSSRSSLSGGGPMPPEERYYFGPTRLQTKRIRLKSSDGALDFTITGGNHLQPVQVGSVVWASSAYLQGMRPGDEILSVNGIPFHQGLDYTGALQILYSSPELEIVIRTLRVNSLDATLYDWYDPIQQRATSPPPADYLSASAQLPFFERTVNVSVDKGKRLGLIIRGGAEYGLGVFISGVDKGSLSDQAGLSIGDQILAVNGVDFRRITHSDAVELLRNAERMSFHLRQINKLPKPKEEMKLSRLSRRALRRSVQPTRSATWGRGFAQKILDRNDRAEAEKTFEQYVEERVGVDQLVKTMLRILERQEQQNRDEVMESIRKSIRRNDLDRFDILLIKDDLSSLKLSHERLAQSSNSPPHNSFCSPALNLSRSAENLPGQHERRLARPESLPLDGESRDVAGECSPRAAGKRSNESANRSVERNPLRKTRSLHAVAKQEEFLPLNKSLANLTAEQMDLIDGFLRDYSAPYRITVHKVRPTLGIAIEGGFQDRVPLPRIVYMQPDGCAYVSSGLRVGHVIVGLNGYSMKGLSHREAALFIASTFKDKASSQMDLLVVEPLLDE